VQIEGERSSAFLKRLPKQVNATHDQRQRFRKSFAAASFCAGLIQIHFSTGFP
jgi:hypothetical protein